MPASSWFHKLRRKRRKGRPSGACPSPSPIHGAAEDEPIAVVTTTVAWADDQRTQQRQRPIAEPRSPAGPAPAPCAGYSPNRPSYYFPTADRAARPDGGLRCIAPRGGGGDDDSTVLDVRVDVVHRRAGRLGGIDAPPATPELNLRRIVTRPLAKNEPAVDVSGSSDSITTSAATTPSTSRARGFHVKPASTRRRRRRGHDDDNNVRKQKEKEAEAVPAHVGTTTRGRRWLYESLVVVKTSSDPEREMAESMAEMVAANRIRSPDDLQELLACYLALNAAEHHRAVVAAFRRVWLHIASQRLLHHPRH
ncbi:hypothetical protein QYE76_068088 [Lolium multiflorum]|uniref:Transcription repressor n=1 Tax=Lolium multiflorum TaxID=4521 RepID=A0AAD8WBL2_LOLMU|nr:hypothetical protein QYE76_068088 [Lolium multiflorum]